MTEKDATEEPVNASNQEREVTFTFMKSNFFRVIHADGAWGGVSPRGDIHITFYNERGAIPDKSIVTLSDSGEVKRERNERSSAIVREVEADVIVDLPTAMQLHAWLTDKIELLQDLILKSQSSERPDDDAKKIRAQ